MAMSPSSLLAKLDELKRWQQVQQERLLQHHQERLDTANTQFSQRDDSIVASTRIDDVPRRCDTIYESIVEDGGVGSPGNKPKQPFLRRGSGLAKYGLQYGDQKRPFNKMKQPKVYKTVFHKRLDQIRNEELKASKHKEHAEELKNSHTKVASTKSAQTMYDVSKSPAEITPLKAPEAAIKHKGKWCTVEPDDFEPTCLSTNYPSHSKLVVSYPNQSQAEMQEDKDEESHENLQQELLQNNPMLFECLQKLAATHFGNPESGSLYDQTDLLNKLTLLDNDSTIYQTPINNNNNQLVKYLQDLLKRTENPAGDLTTYENALAKELQVFEQLEEKALNSSFCSTNSSVAELLASTPHRMVKHKVPSFETIQEVCNAENYVSKPATATTGTQNSFTDSDSTMQSRKSSIAKKMLVYQQSCCDSHNSVQTECSDESSINSDDLDCTNATERIVRQHASTMTDPVMNVNEDLLKNKLQELETEIRSFRTENKKIEKTKADLERQRLEVQKTKKNLEKEYTEKREALEIEFEEERKKIVKEKLVFEKYTKDMQNKPSRKEREEISNLKAELANVKETLKVKESRNGTTQARLRTQIKSLEKDAGHLKEEIEKLQKVNARLQSQLQLGRRGKQDDTKMLHEINKNLSKLTKDQKVVKALSNLEKTMDEKNSSEDSLVTLSASRSAPKVNKNHQQFKTKTMPRQRIQDSESEGEMEKIKNKRNQVKPIRVASSASESEEIPVKLQKSGTNRRSNEYESEFRRPYSRSSCKSDSEDDDYRSKSHNRSRSSVESRKSIENKENEIANGDITNFRNLSDLCVAENYEKVFGGRGVTRNTKDVAERPGSENSKFKRHNSLNDTQHTSGKVEIILADGSKETKYPNGNVKTLSADGNFIKMEYFNGDIKETAFVEGTVKYFYKDTSVWQTTFATGDETFEFPDGQLEKHFSDGSSHIQFPNGIVKHMNADGSEQINYPDGSVVNIQLNGEKILLLPNGQKEIHTDKHKRREYPDGTVKIIYADGLQETRYSNGRIRMKDIDGNLIMDSHKD